MPRLPGQSLFILSALAAVTLSLAACDNSKDATSGKKDQPAATEQGQKPAAEDGSHKAGDDQKAGPADQGDAKTVPEKLTPHTETLKRSPDGCHDDCPVFEAELELYDGQPALNQAIRERLTSQLVANGEDTATPDSLEAAAEQFLATAAGTGGDGGQGWQLSGNTKQLGRWRTLVTVAINSYEYTGGAHGMPMTQWLNWDLASDEPVYLGNLIETGQEDAFWQAAHRAHHRWLEKEVPKDDGNFQEDWPFQQTDSFRLTNKGVLLNYNVYSIAPYSMGQPQLTLPWDDLKGVIRARYRPE